MAIAPVGNNQSQLLQQLLARQQGATGQQGQTGTTKPGQIPQFSGSWQNMMLQYQQMVQQMNAQTQSMNAQTNQQLANLGGGGGAAAPGAVPGATGMPGATGLPGTTGVPGATPGLDGFNASPELAGLGAPGLTTPGLTPGLTTPGLTTPGLTAPTLGTPGLGGLDATNPMVGGLQNTFGVPGMI